MLLGSSIGVLVGIANHDWASIGVEGVGDVFKDTGTVIFIAANRISYVLGLRGPSVALNTACSASLVATHVGLEALGRNRNGFGSVASVLVAGVKLALLPSTFIFHSAAAVAAPSGRSKTFDSAANGMAFGEGCGAMVLRHGGLTG